MDFRRLPSSRTLPRRRGLLAGLALVMLSAPLAQAEPLAEIGSSFDEAGRALNRQIGDWVGAPAKPRAATRRRAMPATAPLPPTRPAEFAAQTPAATQAAAPVTAAVPLRAPEAPAEVETRAAIPAPPSAREEMRLAARPAAKPDPTPVPIPEPAEKAATEVPLPPIRPSGATAAQAEAPPAEKRIAALPPTAETPAGKPAPAAEAVPTICPELSNGELGVFEPSVVTATNPLCTVDRGVTLSAVRMKDGRLVALSPAATLRCEMAASVAVWLREKVEPVVATLGAPLDKVEVAASQQCRPRNRVAGAKISEHGRGNAIDIGGFVLKDGRSFVIGRPSRGALAMPLDFQDRLKLSACADFTTILGPGSDGYHEQHLHLDRAQRRSGAVLCQWATARIEATAPKPPVKPAEGGSEAKTPPEPPAQDEADAPEPATTAQ